MEKFRGDPKAVQGDTKGVIYLNGLIYLINKGIPPCWASPGGKAN
jgi:hypothetical protein